MFRNPFSFQGRIRRLEYGLTWVIFAFAYVVISTASGIGDKTLAGLLSLICVVWMWLLYAQGAKRCHDLGRSGWYQIIPFYGLWLLFAEGNPSFNDYGHNPKRAEAFVRDDEEEPSPLRHVS